jgi:hypothetical protein
LYQDFVGEHLVQEQQLLKHGDLVVLVLVCAAVVTDYLETLVRILKKQLQFKQAVMYVEL